MTSEVTQAEISATFESDPQVDNSLSGRLARASSTLQALEKILGFEFDGPCPICSGIEGCSHSLRERVEATRQSGEGERLRKAAAGVLAHRVDGPTRGWLRDNRDSRAALDALAAALRAHQSGEGEREDWVAHDGGDCPVDPAATVEIKLRDGSVTAMTAKAVNWRYGTYIFEARRTMPASCEVVAYRLRAGEA